MLVIQTIEIDLKLTTKFSNRMKYHCGPSSHLILSLLHCLVSANEITIIPEPKNI